MVKAKIRSNLISLIILFVIALVLGAGVVYWRQNLVLEDQEAKNEAVESDLRNQISALQDQIATLQSQLTPNPAVIAPTSTSGRIILNQANIEQYRPKDQTACQEKFVIIAATSTVTYQPQRIEAGLTVDLPYSDQWGNDKYQLSPYEEIITQQGTGVVFGPLRVDLTNCIWSRTEQIVFKPSKPATTTLAEIQKNSTELVGKAKSVTLGQITAIRYQFAGTVNKAALQVIGPKYNYEFSQPCDKTNCTAAFAQLEKIVKTIKFLTAQE